MSAMQKAIRRGCEDLALSAAATLLRDAPDKLWQRVGCVAFEDVGLAGLKAVGLATASLGGKQARATLGGEWAVASCVVAELSRAPKCRAADDLLMACELHPAYTQARTELSYLTTRDLISVATGQGSIQERALALWYALGTNGDRSTLVCRRGDPEWCSISCVRLVGCIPSSRSHARGSGELAPFCAHWSRFSRASRVKPRKSKTTNSRRRR
jgi:hypothetical protein